MSYKTIFDEIIRKHQINCFKELIANGFKGVLTMSLEPIDNNNSNHNLIIQMNNNVNVNLITIKKLSK